MQIWLLPLLAVGGVSMSLLYKMYRKGRGAVRVLMYHKVSESVQNMMTVTTQQLEAQLTYLIRNGYQIVPIQNLLDTKSLPPKAVVITFDDAYLSTLSLAYPILKKYNAYTTIFIPTGYVGDLSRWDIDAEPLMNVEQLKTIDKSVISLGLHSHQHQHFGQIPVEEFYNDLSQNIAFFKEYNIDFVYALAYPYGGRPTQKANKRQLFQVMNELGIKIAFRIGNRLNNMPLTNVYEIQRIDVRGTDTLESFKQKVTWGKLF